jgi:O-antigen/teichoic acid export membrane protein
MSATPYKMVWFKRGSWAIADQGLFATANALLNVMLARWLSPAQYGAFAVGYAVFLFIGAIHTGLLTEPLLVFGAGKYATGLRTYFRALVNGHWILTISGSLLLFVAACVARFNGYYELGQAFFGLAATTPFSLLMWFARRAAYVRFQPRLACIASAVYLALLVAGLFTLAQLNSASTFSALLVMAGSGVVSGLWLLGRLRAEFRGKESDVELKRVMADHWNYGRWATATAVVMWVPLNFFFVVLSVYVNFEASASLKALSNLVLPLLQANAALAALLLPAMVARGGNRAQFEKLLRSALCLFAAGAFVYSLVVGIFSRPLVHLLYNGRYDSHASSLRLLLAIPILDGVLVVLACALRSLARPDRVFWGYLGIALFVLSGGVVATQASGLRGAVTALIFAELLGVAILAAGIFAQLQTRSNKREAMAVGIAS